MNKGGYIIFGFPGIGKSSLANDENSFAKFIDLESSNFNDINGNKPDKWYEYYGNVAIDLASQSNFVFASTHKDVLEYITKTKPYKRSFNNIRLLVVYPGIHLKEEWINKLQKRYDSTQSQKDKKALDRIVNHFEEDIKNLDKFVDDNNLEALIIDERNYNLNNYIKTIIQNQL